MEYKALQQQSFSSGAYKIVPIRIEDRLKIMKWRNEQLYHLRQKTLLTVADQDRYFNEVVQKLFDQERPAQILFSYLHQNECIGYGGLVQINWQDKHAEISFLIKTELESDEFDCHWQTYLSMIEKMAFDELGLHKIYTYAFDLRPQLYNPLESSGFRKEAVLKDHCIFDAEFKDVVIHSKLNKNVGSRLATENDVDLTFKWAKDPEVRRYAISQSEITSESHRNWFENKINEPNCVYCVVEHLGFAIGSFRLDINEEGIATISYLLDPAFHGRGLGQGLFTEMMRVAEKDMRIGTLIGMVMPENLASMRIFEHFDFECSVQKADLITYKKEL